MRRLGKQDVDAEEVHGKDRVDNLEALLVHQGAEAFVRGNQALRLLFSDDVELRGERIHEVEFIIEEASAGLRARGRWRRGQR
jgi:hypothetical protein